MKSDRISCKGEYVRYFVPYTLSGSVHWNDAQLLTLGKHFRQVWPKSGMFGLNE